MPAVELCSMPDVELVKKIKSNNHEAEVELFEKYKMFISKYGLKRALWAISWNHCAGHIKRTLFKVSGICPQHRWWNHHDP